MAKNITPLLLLFLTFFVNILTFAVSSPDDYSELSPSSSETSSFRDAKSRDKQNTNVIPVNEVPAIEASLFLVTSADLGTDIDTVARECAKDIHRQTDIATSKIVVTIQDNASMSFGGNTASTAALGAFFSTVAIAAADQTTIIEDIHDEMSAYVNEDRCFIDFVFVSSAKMLGGSVGYLAGLRGVA